MRWRLFLFVFLTALTGSSVAAASDEPPRTTWRPKAEMIVGGLGGFAASYGFALLVRSGATACDGDSLCEGARRHLLIPFAGPFIYAVHFAGHELPAPDDSLGHALAGERGLRWFLVGLLVLDGGVQVGSAVLAVAGVTHHENPKRVRPVLGASYLGLEGTF